jgi:hypothetical protein
MRELATAIFLAALWTGALFVLREPVGAFASATFGQAASALEVPR